MCVYFVLHRAVCVYFVLHLAGTVSASAVGHSLYHGHVPTTLQKSFDITKCFPGYIQRLNIAISRFYTNIADS